MKRIYIGYDNKEPIAFNVCSNSIIQNSHQPISIVPLSLQLLESVYTEYHTDGSNSFTYTRFLVPFQEKFNGWVLYIDGDMVLKDDITKIWDYIDESKAVIVVKHDYETKMNKKYFGSTNENYPRKNWSSVILWNCGHHKNHFLTPEFVQSSTGAFLHRFSWLDDSEIGEIPIEWNWIPDEFGINLKANLLHFTLGIPCIDQFKDSPMAEYWNKEYERTIYYFKGNHET